MLHGLIAFLSFIILLLYAAGQFLPRDALLARYMPSSCVWYAGIHGLQTVPKRGVVTSHNLL